MMLRGLFEKKTVGGKHLSRGVTGFLGRLKICLREERRLKDNQNLKCEDRILHKMTSMKTEHKANEPTKQKDRRLS